MRRRVNALLNGDSDVNEQPTHILHGGMLASKAFPDDTSKAVIHVNELQARLDRIVHLFSIQTFQIQL